MPNDLNLPAAARGPAPCKVTRGPWVVESGGFVGGPPGEGRVCQTWNKFEEDFPNAEGNARLIAAAPDLLSALKGVWDLIESGQLRRNTSDDANSNFAMRQVPFVMALKSMQMAIDKAEGRYHSLAPPKQPAQPAAKE